MSKDNLKEKKETLVSYTNNEIIVDTIISNNKSLFVVFNRQIKEISYLEEITIGDKTFVPMSINSSFIKSGSILFPTDIIEYESKQILLNNIFQFIYKYVDAPKDYIILASYYVILTYVYDNFSEIPYLRVIGDYGSGKSRLLKTIGSICYNPILTNGGTSMSAIFRMIEKFRGTLVIDEADISQSDTNNDMIKLFNNGYQKGNPIMRADGIGFEVNCYEVFGPKIIGGRMEFKDKATESRCFTNIMKRSSRTDIPIGLDTEFYDEAQTLRNKLTKFRYDYYDTIQLENIKIEGLEPRLNQIINPILSLIAKDETKEIIIKSLFNKQGEMKDERRNSLFGVILNIVKNRFTHYEEIYYKDILDDLELIEGTKNMTPRKLGSLFKQNRLKLSRKNDGSTLQKNINTDELERLYEEYSIV